MNGTSVHRHPIKGFFAGLCLGVAGAILLVLYGTIALGTLTPYLVVVFGVALGLVMAYVAPPRRRPRAGAVTAVAEGPTATAQPAPAAASEPTLAAGDWAPTHVVPAEGLTTYAGAEEGGAENGRLDPGLEVQVTRREGDWANIACSNGFTTWVDARQLTERAP